MNTVIIAGALIVNLALLFYSIGFFKQKKVRNLTKGVFWFYNLGLLFDIIATAFMIIGSPNSPFTIHGFVGYSALTVMVIDVALLWNLKTKHGMNINIPVKTQIYSVVAYIWWVSAYITGSLLVMIK